jgi:hypothetical protein
LDKWRLVDAELDVGVELDAAEKWGWGEPVARRLSGFSDRARRCGLL